MWGRDGRQKIKLASVLLASGLVLAGCLTPAERQAQQQEQQAQQQEQRIQEMAAQDDAYCKQQKAQAYDECRRTRLSYRQTMAADAPTAILMVPQPNAMQNAGQWLQCGKPTC